MGAEVFAGQPSRLAARSSFQRGSFLTWTRMSLPMKSWILIASFRLSPCIVESQTLNRLAAFLSDLPSTEALDYGLLTC